MKVTFKYGIGSYSGTVDLMTFKPSTRAGLASIGRRWVMPKLTTQNTNIGDAAKNLKTIWAAASAGYKANLKSYADLYNSEMYDGTDPFFKFQNAYSIWIRAMYAWRLSSPGTINLSTLTISDMKTLSSPLLTVKDTVDAGYLPAVTGYADLHDEL